LNDLNLLYLLKYYTAKNFHITLKKISTFFKINFYII
jgi:hypothetical protein